MKGVCTHGMPTPASCIDCMDEGNLPVPASPKREITAHTWARFDGSTCPWCDRPIRVDDSIALVVSGDYERWGHEVCAQDEVRS